MWLTGSPEVLVICVYMLSVHCCQSKWATSADSQSPWAACAWPVWWIAGRFDLYRAVDCGAAWFRSDGGGIVVQPTRISAHVPQHPPGGLCRQRQPVCTRPVTASQQTWSHCLSVRLHSLSCESQSLLGSLFIDLVLTEFIIWSLYCIIICWLLIVHFLNFWLLMLSSVIIWVICAPSLGCVYTLYIPVSVFSVFLPI